jgi:hypothetical protein
LIQQSLALHPCNPGKGSGALRFEGRGTARTAPDVPPSPSTTSLSASTAPPSLQTGNPPALPGRQSMFDIYGSRPRFVFFASFRKRADRLRGTTIRRPYGTRDV